MEGTTDNGEVLLVPEDQAYIDQMIAKAEGSALPAEAPKEGTDKPSLLAGKFATPADLEAAYLALQSKLGERATQEPPKAEPPAPDQLTIEAAKDAVQDAGLDFGALEREYREAGDLSAESRAALAAKGITQEVVDQFLAGQKAAETLGRQKVFETVGGEQQYRDMIAWASANLSADEIEAFNEVARGSNFAALRMAAAGLYARYEAAEGAEPKLVTASGSRPTVDAYGSWAQVRADMADPRYDRDEAFRRGVEAKLARSNI
jgi:hypothetical protein